MDDKVFSGMRPLVLQALRELPEKRKTRTEIARRVTQKYLHLFRGEEGSESEIEQVALNAVSRMESERIITEVKIMTLC